jgi:transcription antitermination factor NusG
MPKWYALRTRSRFEKVVHEQLRHRGIESFLPVTTRVSQWKDRRKRVEWPLFPGYCLARFQHYQRLFILQSPGVIEIVGSALGRPEPIPDDEIMGIRQVVSSCLPFESYPHLTEGATVQVLRGPLMGLHGTLLRKPDGCQLIVRINIISQGAAVHIAPEDVIPLSPSREVPLRADSRLVAS